MSDSTDRYMATQQLNGLLENLDNRLGMYALSQWIGSEAGLAPENTAAAQGLTRSFIKQLQYKYENQEVYRELLRDTEWDKDVTPQLFNELLEMARDYKANMKEVPKEEKALNAPNL